MKSVAWVSWSLLFCAAACAEGMASQSEDDDAASAGRAGASAGSAGEPGGSAGASSGGAGASGGGTPSTGGTSNGGTSNAGGAGTSSGGTSSGGTSSAGTSSAGASSGGTSGAGASGGTSSGGAGSSGAGGAVAPCNCDSPPSPVCLPDGVTRRAFTSPGACSGGSSCTYPNMDTTCPFGCAGGACTVDPCNSVSCSAPPPSVCNGAAVRTYSGPGTCGGSGACTYPFTDGAACPFGCEAGACKADPCAGVSCNAPPLPVCSGAAVRTYTGPGTCAAGACTYPSSDGAACPFGCEAGACKADPCAGVSCTTPPPPTCFDANTLRTPTGVGTCQPSTGACQFSTTDQGCPGGCAAGVCKQCATAAQCMSNEWCNAGTCASCGAGACGNGACDCGETAATCAADCKTCPTALVIGDWGAGDDGWTYDGLWRRQGAMLAGSTNSYCKSYTQNLTSGANLDLSGCGSATLSFQVKLDDDQSWTPRADKSERLYVQCSGDAGGNWTNLTPAPFPPNQSECGDSYCNSGTGKDRSFSLTAQSIALPPECRTTQARFRFQAKGSCAWRMKNPGWTVDGVTIN